MDDSESFLYAVLVILLIFSAFFSASETALSTVNKLRLRKRVQEESGSNKNAATALDLAENYDRSLFTILIGNNIVNLSFSSIATLLATSVFGPAGAAIATAIVTVLVLAFGEILPKTYASDNSDAVSLFIARPLRIIITILTPLTALFTGLKKLLYLLVPKPTDRPTVTEEELLYMIGSIEEEGVLEEQESDLVQSALQFDEICIHEILTPRVNVVALDVNSSIQEIRDIVVEEGYARIPVYSDSIDNIIGILYSREFLNAYVSDREIILRDMLGKPLFVPRRMKLSQLLTTLKSNQTNIAIVTDDYGGTMGIVTMEDVLEELVGDIWDEDDEIPDGIHRIDENTVDVSGDHALDDLFDELGVVSRESDIDCSTVNGWAIHLFEHIPQVDEWMQTGRLNLSVQEMCGHRIKRLRVTVLPEDAGKTE